MSSWLKYASVACFAAYILTTVIQLTPHWGSFTGAEQFSIAQHLVVLAGVAVFLCVSPKIGALVAVGWAILVPLEKYMMLGQEILAGSITRSNAFAVLDINRVLFLLGGTLLSAALVVVLHFHVQHSTSRANRADA